MENKVVVTVIDESATVEAKNDLVHFTLTMRAKSDELESAKSQVKTKSDQVFQMIDGLKAAGMKLDGEVISTVLNYKLEHREGNEKMPVGFQSVNTISFTAFVDDKLDDIHKACLKLDPNMMHPRFSIKDAVTLYEQALEKVSKNVKEKLEKECSLMGIAPSALRIQNWSFGYEGFIRDLNLNAVNNYYTNSGYRGPTGPQGATGAVGPTGPIGAGSVMMKIGSTYQELLDPKLEPGTHSVSIAARVNYVWA